jgi:hypothetical protein
LRELVFEFKYVDESVPAPGSPGGFAPGCLRVRDQLACRRKNAGMSS